MSSPNELERLLQGLVGRICWQVEFLQDGSLWLDFGAAKTGELWDCLTVAVDTPWEITDNDGGTVTNDDKKAEESLDLVEGKIVAAIFDPETFGLFLLFANGCSFYVAPSPDDGLRQGPSWRLATPGNVINAGPGTKWRKV